MTDHPDIPFAGIRLRGTEARMKAFEEWWNERGHPHEADYPKDLAKEAFCCGIVDQEAWVICGPVVNAQLPVPRLREWTRRLLPMFTTLALIIANFFAQRTISDYHQIVTNQNEALANASQTIEMQSAAVKRVDAALAACHCAPLPNHKSGSSSIIHVPPNGNCPDGDTLRKGFFTEGDGSKQDACVNPKGNGSIDELKPGEGVEMLFQFESPKPTDKNGRS